MKDEAISSSGDPLIPPGSSSSPHRTLTPAASSAGASSPAIPTNATSTDWFYSGQNSKGASLSRVSLQPSAVGSANGSSRPSCRPWERGDLLRRLSTFKPANWFGKPKAASSLACARRGWVNVDLDKIKCESCGATLKFISPTTWTSSEADSAGENFAKKLDEGHEISCPWIGNTCAESLVQFPPTPPSALIGGYKDRCDGLLQFPTLPIVAASAIEQMKVSRGPEIDRFLAQSIFASGESFLKQEIISGTEHSRDNAFFLYSRAQNLISLCGWEPRWLPNVQDYEEHSAQSARNGCSIGPSKFRGPHRDRAHGKKPLSTSKGKGYCSNEIVVPKSNSTTTRSPLLDCSLCGATVRIWDFIIVARPACFAPNSSDVPESSKKMVLTRGVSAASGINGWVAADGTEREQAEDHEEAATNEGKSLSNIGVDLNLTVSAGLSSSRLHMNVMSEDYQDGHRRRDLLTGHPSSSEVGDRAASYESRGPSSRKRNLDEGGSTVDRSPLLMQQTDSIEGTVIDRDGDEVDGREYSAGPSKRARDSDVFETNLSLHQKYSSGAGPSQSFGFGTDAQRDEFFDKGLEKVNDKQPARDLTRISSVIAMDTVCHSADNDSMESVENYPGDFADVHLPSTSTLKSTDVNETSEVNYGTQVQQRNFPVRFRGAGEIGISSTNDEEVLNADATTAQGRDGTSIAISGGSVGMGASHEAEIHGTDASVQRADSVVGDVEQIAEITDNQVQTSEFVPDPGLMGDFIPEEIDREDPHGDSQDLISRSVRRADCGSKIVGSAKAESFESGERTSNLWSTPRESSPHPSLSCNAILCSGYEASREEVTQIGKDLTAEESVQLGYLVANGTGPPQGESNYEEAVEFDPIKYHNPFCPWVNGNVAAAGCTTSTSGSGSSAGTLAFCGWQLTLDALDAFQSFGQVPIQTMESESAASMFKDDHKTPTPSRKLLARHSFNKSHGRR